MRLLLDIFIDEYRKSKFFPKSKYMSQKTRTLMNFIMFAVTAGLTVLNAIKGYDSMMKATSILALGFLVCMFLSLRSEKQTLENIITAIIVAVSFSYFAISGGNFGFAILWILLVPFVGMEMLGLKMGTCLAAYFQLFVVFIFYTPAISIVAGLYTDTFCMRFPILYFTAFMLAAILAVQKDYYFGKTVSLNYIEELTGLHNRRYYNELFEKLNSQENDSVAFVSLDINGLKCINDNFGHMAGDEVIKAAGECIRKAFRGTPHICRIGGDEFSVVVLDHAIDIDKSLEHLNDYTSQFSQSHDYELSLSVGIASSDNHPDMSYNELEQECDRIMYLNKSRYYCSAGKDRRHLR